MKKNYLIRNGIVYSLCILFIGAIIFQTTANSHIETKPAQIINMIANEIHVDDDNTGGPWDGSEENPYQKIEDGVNAAENGDTVFVHEGTYNENNIPVNNAIEITGENKDTTIVNAGGSYSGFLVWVSDVTISRFTIQNSGTTNLNAGIFAADIDGLTITKNNIINTMNGVVIWNTINVTITDNHITDSGQHGIYSKPSSLNKIAGNTIKDCNVHGILLEDSSDFNISINLITNCLHTGIYLDNSHDNTLKENRIAGNMEYGIYLQNGASENLFYLNSFIENGGTGGQPRHHAYDPSLAFNNRWNVVAPIGGNYWDDFDEPGEGAYDDNDDGFADKPYNIPVESKDGFPRMAPGDDNELPQLWITEPEQGMLYIKNNVIMRLPFKIFTIIVKEINITVDAIDNLSGVSRIEFYIDDELKANATETPYYWEWIGGPLFGLRTIKVIAYDKVGNTASTEINRVLKIL